MKVVSIRKAICGLVLGVSLLAFVSSSAMAKSASPPVPDAAQTSLVTAEQARITHLNDLTELQPSLYYAPVDVPYQVPGSSLETLVLTARQSPYTITDLVRLAPHGVMLESTGTYLIAEDLFVERGATLEFTASSSSLRVSMLSGPAGFTSIVSYGGELVFKGSQAAPVEIDSYDPVTKSPATNLDAGRAYIRAIGGSVLADNVRLSELGFADGATSGFAITGYGPTSSEQAGAVSIRESTFQDNGIGLYISGVDSPQVSDCSATANVYSGFAVDYYATGTILLEDVASDNAGDGFHVASGASNTQMIGDTADSNGVSGFSVNGNPPAHADSQSEAPVDAVGEDTISSGRAFDNGFAGIDVTGAVHTTIRSNRIGSSPFGIDIRDGSHDVTVTSNQLEDLSKIGIWVRDGVQGAALDGNHIRGAKTGVYLRSSEATITGNLVSDATDHAVELVESVTGSTVTQNTFGGAGPSAIYRGRVQGDRVLVTANDDSSWVRPLRSTVHRHHLLNPLTLIWLPLVGLFVVAPIGVRRPQISRPPYPKLPFAVTSAGKLRVAGEAGGKIGLGR